MLVHCAQGISRSSTLIISYMIRHMDYTLKAALTRVRSRRSVAHPNSDFMRQLCAFELKVHGVNSLTPQPLDGRGGGGGGGGGGGRQGGKKPTSRAPAADKYRVVAAAPKAARGTAACALL